MKKTFIYLMAMLVLGLTSCEEVIDYELRSTDTKLVVDGLITDQPGPYSVRLTSTKGYLEEGTAAGVNGALVIVSDNLGTIDTLKQVSEGLYQTSILQGQPGNTYYLKVMTSGKEYTAQSYMPAVAPIDSLTFVYKAEGHMVEEGYFPYIHFRDPAGKGNYYRWDVTVNGERKPDELAVESDELFEDRPVHANMGVSLQAGDAFTVELYALDKAAYEFWLALKNQQHASGGPFEKTPANAPGNISGGAVGYFGASAVSVATGVSR
ncbi:DUF4249 domain-containing protein [Pontibacter sp. MBLB2868]|uniref:DUF4249 domain-containing protein n=1 Tax=Pontibacter sp. MBLB2868 TaxID=3451555 RepID=UPI003F751D46